ncbi:MAG: chaperone NapD, partial [Betaproteobacteria bacterium]|nr:chaperone NapD [Betaproteobacteria bacterium]
MSILGAVVRTTPANAQALALRLALVPGVEVAPHPGDGRIVIVLEDVDAVTRAVNDDSGDSAAARFARI